MIPKLLEEGDEPPHIVAERLRQTSAAAHGVTRVVHRCNDAKRTNMLDLSGCGLMQMPDAVYHLMRHVTLLSCCLANNQMTKITSKLPNKFKSITALDVSHNGIGNLPDAMSSCTALKRLNISHNAFLQLPLAVFTIPGLTYLDASNNYISDVDIDRLDRVPRLHEIDLRENPIQPTCHQQLRQLTNKQVQLTELQDSDFEDDQSS